MLLEVAITFKPQENQKPKKYYDVRCYKDVCGQWIKFKVLQLKKVGFYKSRHKAEHEQEAEWAHKTSLHLPFREFLLSKKNSDTKKCQRTVMLNWSQFHKFYCDWGN